MTLTFSPPRAPSAGTTVTITPRVNKAQFGDGYMQRVSDGLNTVQEKWNVVWNNLTTDQSDTIRSFFEARGGVEAFFWTAPDSTTTKKYICTSWTPNLLPAGYVSLTAQFEQVFDL